MGEGRLCPRSANSAIKPSSFLSKTSPAAGQTPGSSGNACAAGCWYHYPPTRLSFLDLGRSLLANIRINGVQGFLFFLLFFAFVFFLFALKPYR